jgi:hypothetical protein
MGHQLQNEGSNPENHERLEGHKETWIISMIEKCLQDGGYPDITHCYPEKGVQNRVTIEDRKR